MIPHDNPPHHHPVDAAVSFGGALFATITGPDFGRMVLGIVASILAPAASRAVSTWAAALADRWRSSRAENAELIRLRSQLQVMVSAQAVADMRAALAAIPAAETPEALPCNLSGTNGG